MSVLSQKSLAVVKMDYPKSDRSPCIQLPLPNDWLGMNKIAVFDAVQCNDGIQGTRKCHLLKRLN